MAGTTGLGATADVAAPRREPAARTPPPRGRPPVRVPFPTTALAAATTALLVALPGAAAPWTAAPLALLLATVLVLVQLLPGPCGARRLAPGDRVPVVWGVVTVLALLAPLPLVLLARVLPVALRADRSGAPLPAAGARAARALVGVAVCRATGCALVGAPFLGGPAVTDAAQWPAVLLAGAAGLGADRALLAVHDRRAGRPRAPRRPLPARAVLLASVLVCAPVVVGASASGPVAVVLVAGALVLLLVAAALAQHHERGPAVDGLTGLLTRDALLARLHRPPRPASAGPALLVVDLDRFTEVNEAFGHGAGDDLLREVAARVRGAVRGRGAAVARWGGDEFAVLLPDGQGAGQLAAALVREAGRPVRVGRCDVLLPVSVGVALPGAAGGDPTTLVREAHAALRRAKLVGGAARTSGGGDEPDATGGAGRVGPASAERVRLRHDLAAALQRGELSVDYQPQVAAASGRVVGAEALVRWRHPQLGAVGPDRFVPLAEQSDLVDRLTAFVLDTALADLAAWRAAGHAGTVSVNLAARSLADEELTGRVAAALARHGVPADALVLEITETGVVAEPLRARRVVRALRDLGCSVAVDDFGTGNASLGHLADLAVDELKVDRSFVAAMGTDRARGVILAATVRLGRDLGLRVVAEGVADAATARALVALGVDRLQGEHVGVPVPADRLLAALREERVHPS